MSYLTSQQPPPTTVVQPSLRPRESETQSLGVYNVDIYWSPRVELGSTERFSVVISHTKDGSIDPTGIALKIFDSTGAQVTTGVTVDTPVKDSGGNYHTDVQFVSPVIEGNYVFEWSGTYQAVGENVSHPFKVRHFFRVVQTIASTTFTIVKQRPDAY